VQNDNSLQTRSHSNNAKPRKNVTLPVIYSPNVASGKNKKRASTVSGLEEDEKEDIHSGLETPLMLAASKGIIEIVKKIIEVHPEALAFVEDEQNLLHVAVKYRQRNVYRLIKRYGALSWLAAQIGNRGQSLLHQVASMDCYSGGNQVGVVFQLQDEICWFEVIN